MSKSFSQSQDPSCEPRQNENQRFHPKVCNSTHSKSEIAKVASGLNTIHSANMQYWTCGAVPVPKKGPHINAGWDRGKKSVALLQNPFLERRPIQLKCTQRRIKEKEHENTDGANIARRTRQHRPQDRLLA
jgi:hypothetical protein